MQKLMNEVIRYIEFLKRIFGYHVSMHYDDLTTIKMNTLFDGALAFYNSHQNAYCMQVKRCGLNRKCRECQLKTIEKLKNSDGFLGVCHAGVAEYVFPIRLLNRVIGFISISGYKTLKDPPVKIFEFTELSEKQKEQLCNAYHTSLFKMVPSFGDVAAVINPLSRMIELFFEKIGTESIEHPENSSAYPFYSRVVQFINDNRCEDISVEKIAEHFNCSRSYISHIFKKNNGNSIRYYCNSLRIADAKVLLEQTGLTVTEIAFIVGFSDSNYFTATFQSFCGISPLKWRKTH